MPTEPLFDISGVDLSATAADLAQIAELLPHRGHMLQIARVVWHDETYDHGVAVKHVRSDEFWVPGHIPGQPLLPGVLMIEASAQLASWLYYNRTPRRWFAGFTRIEDTTFRGQVVPGDDLYLLCKCLKYNSKRFVCSVQGLVDGTIVFDSKVTGMAFPKLPEPVRGPLELAEGTHTSPGSVVGPS